jgi:putative CocE/NonD family hydrolase
MRDGVRLCATVFRPAKPGRLPALLTRTPYGKPAAPTPNQRVFLEHGYAVVVQDVRGRFDSEGTFVPVAQEMADGEDTISWIVRQPWSDGQVGMFGGSYPGIAQWRAALSGHPALKAIAPVMAGWDEYTDRYYSPGGAFKLAHRLVWLAENLRLPYFPMPDPAKLAAHRPLRTSDKTATGRTIDFYQAAIDHPSYDDYWKSLSTRESIDKVRVPALIFSGWYDNYVESDLAAFQALRERGRAARIIVGPYGHNMSQQMPGEDFGADPRPPVIQMELQWFDEWMKRGAAPAEPPARLYLTGANVWRQEEVWPPRRMSPRAYYLCSDGRLCPRPSWKAGARRYSYEPSNPVPTLGGAICCNFKAFPWGPADQRPIGTRPDVLIFETSALTQAVEATGPVQAVLYVSSSATDTDFTAKLIDVGPDGRQRLVCDGILRLRYRNGLGRAEVLTPGEVARIVVPSGVTSHVFGPGHRIRLDVSSSNYPRFDRNPNTGKPVADEIEWRTAEQTVWFGGRRASHLLLPVVPARVAVR